MAHYLSQMAPTPCASNRNFCDVAAADNLPYEKVGKNEPVCIADEVPFEIPESWEWVRLGSIGETNIGLTYKPSDKVDKKNGIAVLRSNNIQKGKIDYNDMIYVSCNVPERAMIDKGDILICARNGSRALVGKSAIVDIDGMAFGAFMAKYTSFLSGILNAYILIFIESPVFRCQLDGVKTETINQITQNMIREQLIPIPPLEEQLRINKKLEEIMPYIEKYGTTHLEVTNLNDAFPASLKKSILQEAIQGKLVPQDPSDEPASVLLERIRAEKERLIQEGKIKRDKQESVIYRRDNSHYEKLDGIERCIDDEIPFEIPKTWEWTRLGQVISLLSGTDFKPEEYNDKCKGIPYITGASSLSENGVLINRWTETPKIIANYGDVLLVCKGSGYGKTVICDIERAHIARQIMAIKNVATLYMLYIRLFLQASFEYIKSKGQGVIPGIDRNSVMNMLFPIPPLAEQKRIVEKQKELFDKISLI